MELKLLKHQLQFVKNFREQGEFWAEAIISGFGAGKTFTLSSAGIISLLEQPGHSIGVYSATFDLINLVNVPSIQEILRSLGLGSSLNKKDMIIRTDYGKFILRSMDNPARIIGYEHAHALVDELDTLTQAKAEDSWNKIIARNRQSLPTISGKQLRNKIGVGTTPEGFKFVYKRWKKNPPAGYRMIKAKTSDNPHLPHDYVDNLISSYPDNLKEAYVNGEFVNLQGNRVYYAYEREKFDFGYDSNEFADYNREAV